MWIVSLVSLVGVIALCAIGTFSKSYRDNMGQRAGMAGMALTLGALTEHIFKTGSESPVCALLSVSMLVYAVSTAAKVVHFTRKRRNELPRPTQADPVS